MSEFIYVPVEPTDEMIAAGCKAGWFGVKAIIKAALEAAPTQPSPAKSYDEGQKDDDRIPLDRLADHISESWPDKKFGLDEICQRLNEMWPAEFMPPSLLPSPAEADMEAAQPSDTETEVGTIAHVDHGKSTLMSSLATIASHSNQTSDREMLDWFCNDMAKDDESVGIHFFEGKYCFPYLDNGSGGLGGGVCMAKFDSLREAIKAAMQADREVS